MTPESTVNPTISVIVPTFNEAAHIGECLASIRRALPGAEILVADAGSGDETTVVAKELGATVIVSVAGRGHQINGAAAIARGELLVLLHADCRIDIGAALDIAAVFADPQVLAAKFTVKFGHPARRYRCVEWCSRFDSLLTSFGDQGIAVRRVQFVQRNLMPCSALFEDVQFFRNVRKLSRVVRLPTTVTTSTRRFEKFGFFRTHALNTWLILRYLCGASTAQLHRCYYRGTGKA